MLLAVTSCMSQQTTAKNEITQTYPELYEAIYSRDAGQILPFTKHDSPQIRRQAWRGLAHTPVNAISSFVEDVKQDGSRTAWFALSLHDLKAAQLRDLETHWIGNEAQRAGLNIVLGQQGDAQTVSFFQNQWEKIIGTDYEKDAALAVSRLIIRQSADTTFPQKIIDAAFAADDPAVIRVWLYGFYQGDLEVITPEQKDMLYSAWKSYGIGKRAVIDQYAAKILGPRTFSKIINHYTSSKALDEQVQLGIELANLVDKLDITQGNTNEIKRLLNHPNPHVVQQTLQNVSARIKEHSDLWVFIESKFLEAKGTNPIVWLETINIAARIDASAVKKYADGLAEISRSNAYLYPRVLDIWMQTDTSKVFLNKINEAITGGNELKSMYAVNALNKFWSAFDEKSEIKDGVRAMTFKALELGDRGVSFSTQPLLQDSLLFTKDDFPRINRSLNKFNLPGDIEVYQTFGALYKQRFEAQARPVIDSLAALDYAPLNRSLNQAGWEIEVPDDSEPQFRAPDWNRLWELGEHPVWVLETEKGIIKVEMNTLSAPATVSAIDSLTQTGAYNGVPFHRVVPNFVIQGGDIERQDGFGGPDFTIPTEPSELGFVRGAAGIASAGPDTEGSQYFFMHQWKPHLNGGYTLFGNVIEGMDVVDRIIVGDTVKRAYWQ